MIFEMRTDAVGGVPQKDINLVTNCLLPGFSWQIVWIADCGRRDIPLFVASTDDHGQKTADYRTLKFYFMTESEQVKVRRALGTLQSSGKLILRRMHVPETEKHLLELKTEDVAFRAVGGRLDVDAQEAERRFMEDAKYSTEFEIGTWEELGVTDFVEWAKGLNDPFHERILS